LLTLAIHKHRLKQVAHNVAVHYELASGEVLKLRRDDGTILFTTAGLVAGTKRLDVEIVADNSTAEKFYREALTFSEPNCWLPNQGDPPPIGGKP
jgi:hypothetical protein